MDLQALFDQARQRHGAGDLSGAESLYRQLAQAAPGGFGAFHMLGLLQAQQGRHAEALANCERAIALKPDFAEAQYNRGMLLWRMRRFPDALGAFDRVLALTPQHAGALFNRGVVLGELNRFEEAVETYDKVLAAQPDFAPALGNRGIALWKLKLADAALASYDRALALEPGNAGTWYNRGLLLAEQGRLEDALESYDKALALAPDSPDMLHSRGLVLFDLKRFEEAVASYDRALALAPRNVEALSNRGLALLPDRPEQALASFDAALAVAPDFAPAWNNRGLLLKALGRLPEALASYDRALALDARNAEGWNARGSILVELKRFEDAVKSYNTALSIRPDFAEALNNRAYGLWAGLGLIEPAMRDLERLLTLAPDFPDARGELLLLHLYGGDWRDYDTQVAALDAGVRAGRRVARPFVYQAVSQSPADLQACSRIFAQARFRPAATPPPPPPAAGKIRLGYVSADFRVQATALLTAGLYERHDRDRFEVVAFDNGRADGSDMRKRLEAAFDRLVPIAGLPDEAAAALVREQKIDILVNLNGYFGAPRMGVFARRPAPVQVNYLGFPATLGAPYIDYIVADRIVIPESERHYYDEKVVWLPDSYQVNDSERAIAAAASRAEHSLPEGALVFCNFNQSYKLSPQTFACWMKILGETDGSVLWLLDSFAMFRDNLGREAERHGVARERLIFAPPMPPAEHLARLALADLFLDTWPYNAHTTASDALWAGLPLVTLRGTAFAGRVAASLLSAAGLPELIAETPDAYVQLALALADDRDRLRTLREKVSDARRGCPLFDTARFTRHIEAAFTTMVEIARRGEAPRAFAVTPLP
jgi:predicted O-linked N-acetylglucosamine transferase (SPINDLY family)